MVLIGVSVLSIAHAYRFRSRGARRMARHTVVLAALAFGVTLFGPAGFGFGFGFGDTTHGQGAPYLVLRGPYAGSSPHARGPVVPARTMNLAKPAYAYGWFGAQPRRQTSTHYGYRQNYILWVVE